MFSEEAIDSFTLMFVLLNPFLMGIYLLDLIKNMKTDEFIRVLIRGSIISSVAFIFFAWTGDALFQAMKIKFESFLIFGGIIFLIIGIRYVFDGSEAIASLRGKPEHVAGSIALPFMIGPGTISGSVIVGSNLDMLPSALVIIASVASMIFSMFWIKVLHDYVKARNEVLVERYIDVTGRISALLTGMIAIEMIGKGLISWYSSIQL